MKQSTKTYTKRVNARRAGVTAGIPRELIAITVHKNGDEVRFGWEERALPIKETMTIGGKPTSARKAERGERNGVKRPKMGGVCAAVWVWLDAHPDALLKDTKKVAHENAWNLNNVVCEFYAWRKFNGIGKPP